MKTIVSYLKSFEENMRYLPCKKWRYFLYLFKAYFAHDTITEKEHSVISINAQEYFGEGFLKVSNIIAYAIFRIRCKYTADSQMYVGIYGCTPDNS